MTGWRASSHMRIHRSMPHGVLVQMQVRLARQDYTKRSYGRFAGLTG